MAKYRYTYHAGSEGVLDRNQLDYKHGSYWGLVSKALSPFLPFHGTPSVAIKINDCKILVRFELLI